MVVVKTEREFPVLRGEFFHEFLAYQSGNFSRILTFTCYTQNQVEVFRQLFGLDFARGYVAPGNRKCAWPKLRGQAK